jgi:hypothetical protein
MEIPMSARARRPSAPPTDQLLAALGEARRLTLQVGAAEKSYSSDRYRLTQNLHTAIDALTASVTGDPTYFHAKPHGGPDWNMSGRPTKP